ncbi:Endoribonuclease L-PSP/chorismate mutase-like protein [Phellopilus nigrolimitatus]|nr:Endoribonuclease L-PSP/chorismate mutase-like protein [Phellopilus nigrolimitatus]
MSSAFYRILTTQCLRFSTSARPLTFRTTRLPGFRPKVSTFTQKRDMSLSVVSTENAPGAVGPYSQAIKAGNLIFASGCIPLDPVSKKVVDGEIEAQAKQALANLKAVVEASGSTVDKIAKTTVFLQNMGDFQRMNAVYAEFFGSHKPARSAVEVAKLPLGVLFEIECIALLE